MASLSIYLLLVAGILLDGHSTFIGLKRDYKERNPFLLGLSPRGVRKNTILIWAIISALFTGHLALKMTGAEWYGYRSIEQLFLALALAKGIAALENYTLVYFGSNLGSILRRKPKALFPEPLVDIVITLLIIALPAIFLAAMLYGGPV